ncbi:hypothetical protein CEP54_003330 [Fusarium duplospermum]|uniref:Uncharacterized protein n=1 Tax=Fusarium duplospermum TaxID=1325734 RepID=A0A428QPG8_9HYPO|nr:hypothetical protein CEP54_003330 [Fusarium duplospermum]
MKSTSAEFYTPQPGSRLHYELEYEMARLSQTVDPTTIHKATLLSSYSARRDYLVRVFSENQDSRIQDVMAIVKFPRRDKFVYMPAAINLHLEEWLAHELPNPLEEYLPSELGKAYHFIRLTEQYMEDYLSKALSKDLVYAYLKLPHWCHLSYDEHRTVEVKSQDRVHLNSLSRALAARFADDGFKMPVAPPDGHQEAWRASEGLVFPDNVQFNTELHMTSPDTDALGDLINCLAASGINLIDELLRLDMKECKAFFDHLYDEMTIQTPMMAPRSSTHPTVDRYYNPIIPDEGLWAKLRFHFHFAQGPDDLKKAYIRMYRQRAWAFFDDERLFDDGVNLCDFQAFQKRAQDIGTKEYNTHRSRQQRHLSAMKMGQSPSPHREDLKRGVEYYPTLERVLFWNEVDNVKYGPVRVVKDELFQVEEDEMISGSDDSEIEQEAKGGHVKRVCLSDGFLDEDLEVDGLVSSSPCCPVPMKGSTRVTI